MFLNTKKTANEIFKMTTDRNIIKMKKLFFKIFKNASPKSHIETIRLL